MNSLNEKLEAQSEEAAKVLPEEVLKEFAKGIDAVLEAKIVEGAKKEGEQAPDFTLKNSDGEEVTLADVIKHGEVVLTWYRGGWCPYCNITLGHLQQVLPEIEKRGATLIALTPELPEKATQTSQKNNLGFQILTDLNNEVAEEYGLLFHLTPEVEKIYGDFCDLREYNGPDAGTSALPLAATYVIGSNGELLWSYVDADYTKRAEPTEILSALDEN